MNRAELTERVPQIFAAFDGQDVAAFAEFMTEDVRLRLGNTEPSEGKAAFVAGVEAFLESVASFHHALVNVYA